MNNIDRDWIKPISIIIVALLEVVNGNAPVYKYLGCYYDAVGAGRDLNGRDLTMSTLSLGSCASQCQTAGYPYAGMQMVNQCFCGMSYGYLGPSTDCNTTCQGVYCGGYLSNDIYYDVDYSTMSQRQYIFHGDALSYDDARMVCVSNGGDLATVGTTAQSQAIANIVALNGSNVDNIWFGLRQRLVSGPYEWCDETTAVPYSAHTSDFSSFWTTGDSETNPCVQMSIPSQKWQSVDCSLVLPFVCLQIPPPPASPDNDYTTAANPTTAPNTSQMLALYIVLPLFAFCYGGSCLFYCIHKIYQNCIVKKRHTKMSLDRVEAAEPMNGARPRASVYQPPPMAVQAMPLPAKDPLATAFYATAPMKPAYQYQHTIDPKLNEMPRMTKADFPPQTGFMNPVVAQEDKRARLLQNAAVEARGRRQLQPKEEAAEDKSNDVKTKSTANLLDANSDVPDMTNMSIKDILKMKMEQNNEKKKKRGIIST